MTEFGPYRILDTLGRGGMGVVYRALLPGTDRIVALKVLANAFNDLEQYARFKREIRLTQELKHPQLVEVLDSGVQSDSLFIVMELVEGEDLAKVLKRRGRLAAREGARIVGLTASGLAHLHSLNVLHRDVKPDNILLASDGRIKLADYGLLRNESGTPITSENALVGTLSYLSPEALQGEDPTPAADLWALGCVAYRLLTGRPPVELGDTPVGILSQMAGNPQIPHPSALNDEIPRELGDLVMRLLHPEPAKRVSAATAAATLQKLAVAPSRRDAVARMATGTSGPPEAGTRVLGEHRLDRHWVRGFCLLVVALLLVAGVRLFQTRLPLDPLILAYERLDIVGAKRATEEARRDLAADASDFNKLRLVYLLRALTELGETSTVIADLKVNATAPASRALAQAFLCEDQGDWVGADSAFREAVAAAPEAIHIRVKHWWFLFQHGRYSQAEEMRKVLARDVSRWVRFQKLCGDMESSRQHGVDAQMHYRKTLELRPTSVEGRLGLAGYLIGYDPDAAEKLLKEALQLDPDHPVVYGEVARFYLRQRRIKEAESFITAHRPLLGSWERVGRLMALASTNQTDLLQLAADTLAKKSDIYMGEVNAALNIVDSKGEVARAEGFASLGLKRFPRSPEVHTNRARLFERHNRFAEAEVEYRRAIEKCGLNANYLIDLGNFLESRARQADAVKVFTQATVQDPTSPIPYVKLGLGLEVLHESARARECLRRATELDPKLHWAASIYSGFLERNGETIKAEEILLQMVKRCPDDSLSFVALAAYHYRHKKEAEGNREVQRALALDPRSFDARYAFVNYAISLKRWEEALQIAKELVALHPTRPMGHAVLGDVLDKLHRPAEAVAEYAVAVAGQSNIVSWGLSYAHNLILIGERSKGYAEILRLLAAHPEHGKVREAYEAACREAGGRAAELQDLRQFAEAEALLVDLANTLDPPDKIVLQLAEIQQRWLHTDASEKTLRGLLRRKPKQAQAVRMLSTTLMLQGRLVDAAAEREHALALERAEQLERARQK